MTRDGSTGVGDGAEDVSGKMLEDGLVGRGWFGLSAAENVISFEESLGSGVGTAFVKVAAGAELLALTGDGSAGIGGGTEDVTGKMLETRLAGRAKLGLSVAENAASVDELLGSGDGAAFVSGVAGAGGPGLKGAVGTDGDCSGRDWSSEKMVTSSVVSAWSRLSTGVAAGETAIAGVAESACAEVNRADAGETSCGDTGVSDAEAEIVGVGESSAGGVDNCVGALEGCVGI